jgi:DNA-binding transcriptional LysR family regulator
MALGAALKAQDRGWHLSFVSPSFEFLKSAAVEGLGITVLARALVTPPLRVIRHGLGLPDLPSVELAYARGRRSNSRVVTELAKPFDRQPRQLKRTFLDLGSRLQGGPGRSV